MTRMMPVRITVAALASGMIAGCNAPKRATADTVATAREHDSTSPVPPAAPPAQPAQAASSPSPAPTTTADALAQCVKGFAAYDTSYAHVTPLTGAVQQYPSFSLFVPDSATINVDTSLQHEAISLAFANCPKCRFGVVVMPDGGKDVEARVAERVAEQRRIDSVNADPHRVAFEFDDMDGPPRPFNTSTGRGYEIDESCGDCASTTLLMGRPGSIATISFGGDDDAPQLPVHLCEMDAIAKSFAWRP